MKIGILLDFNLFISDDSFRELFNKFSRHIEEKLKPSFSLKSKLADFLVFQEQKRFDNFPNTFMEYLIIYGHAIYRYFPDVDMKELLEVEQGLYEIFFNHNVKVKREYPYFLKIVEDWLSTGKTEIFLCHSAESSTISKLIEETFSRIKSNIPYAFAYYISRNGMFDVDFFSDIKEDFFKKGCEKLIFISNIKRHCKFAFDNGFYSVYVQGDENKPLKKKDYIFKTFYEKDFIILSGKKLLKEFLEV